MRISIFLFHRVNPQRNALWDPIDPALFEKIIQVVQKKFSIVQLEDFLLNGSRGVALPKKAASIVFDDGFKDNLEYALPILRKYKCPASLYVVTDCITHGIPTWNFEIDYLFENTDRTGFVFHNSICNGSILLANAAERNAFSLALKHKLKFVKNNVRLKILDEIRSQICDVQLPDGVMLNWDDLRMMYKEGIYIGSHTATHARLGYIEKEADIRKEMELSKKEIEHQLGYSPVTISYPMGSYNDTVKRISAETGYSFGLAVNESGYDLQDGDLFEINRIQLFNESWLKSWLRIHGYMQFIKKVFGRRVVVK